MFQFSLPAEVGQSVSYPTRGGCAEGTATIKRVFANQKLGAHYLLETLTLRVMRFSSISHAVPRWPCRTRRRLFDCAYFKKPKLVDGHKVYSSDMWTSTD